jgi:hypothetical protein
MADGSTNGNPKSNPSAQGGSGSSQPQKPNNSRDVLDAVTGQVVSAEEMAKRSIERRTQVANSTYLPEDMKQRTLEQIKKDEEARKATGTLPDNGEKTRLAQEKTLENGINAAKQTGRTDIYMPVPPPSHKAEEHTQPASHETKPADGKDGTSSAALDALNKREKVAESGALNRPSASGAPSDSKGLAGIYMPAVPSANTDSPKKNATEPKKDDPTLTTRALQQSALINDPLSDTLNSLNRVPNGRCFKLFKRRYGFACCCWCSEYSRSGWTNATSK